MWRDAKVDTSTLFQRSDDFLEDLAGLLLCFVTGRFGKTSWPCRANLHAEDGSLPGCFGTWQLEIPAVALCSGVSHRRFA